MIEISVVIPESFFKKSFCYPKVKLMIFVCLAMAIINNIWCQALSGLYHIILRFHWLLSFLSFYFLRWYITQLLLKSTCISGFDIWHTSRTYVRLILLADAMYGYPFGTLKIGFLERRKRKIKSLIAESVTN